MQFWHLPTRTNGCGWNGQRVCLQTLRLFQSIRPRSENNKYWTIIHLSGVGNSGGRNIKPSISILEPVMFIPRRFNNGNLIRQGFASSNYTFRCSYFSWCHCCVQSCLKQDSPAMIRGYNWTEKPQNALHRTSKIVSALLSNALLYKTLTSTH